MAFVHGKNTVFKLDNAAGTIVDLTAYFTSVEVPFDQESHETTTFGASAKTFIPGLSESSISFEANFDTVLDTHLSAVKSAISAGTLATCSFEYHPAGTTTGTPKYVGEIAVITYSISSGVGDLITLSGEAQVTGAVTRTLNA